MLSGDFGMIEGIRAAFGLRRHRPGWALRKAGDAARDARDWLRADAAYANYLALNPEDWPIWVQRGHSQKESGNLAGAERSYRRAADIAPNQADPFFHLGIVMRMMDRRLPAVEYFKRAAALGNAHAISGLAEFGVVVGLQGQSAGDLLPWVTWQTGVRMLVDAHAARDMQRWEEAEALYTAYLQIRPDSEPAQTGLELSRNRNAARVSAAIKR
jgi:tetratricopeptide (TPR) repeat protein